MIVALLPPIHQQVFRQPADERAKVPPQEAQQPAAVHAVDQPGCSSTPPQETADPVVQHALCVNVPETTVDQGVLWFYTLV